MAAMMSILNGQRNGAKIAGWFRLVALAEALSWAGLLVGMYFKHLATADTEIGVKIFGPLHGGVFVAFLVVALLAGLAFKWGAITWLLALLASIVPLGSVIFVMWAGRTGRLGVEDRLATTPAAAEAA
jgi:integral membrane protein